MHAEFAHNTCQEIASFQVWHACFVRKFVLNVQQNVQNIPMIKTVKNVQNLVENVHKNANNHPIKIKFGNFLNIFIFITQVTL